MVAALALTGCQPKPGEAAAGEETVEIGPKYSAKDGLLVPSDTRLSLGLKIARALTTDQLRGELLLEDAAPGVRARLVWSTA